MCGNVRDTIRLPTILSGDTISSEHAVYETGYNSTAISSCRSQIPAVGRLCVERDSVI